VAASVCHFVRFSDSGKVAGPQHIRGAFLPLVQLSDFGISGGSNLSMAGFAVAADVRSDMGHDPLPAKTVGFLSWGGAAADLCRFDGAADDCLFAGGAILRGDVLKRPLQRVDLSEEQFGVG
jgi:hypothetical protein